MAKSKRSFSADYPYLSNWEYNQAPLLAEWYGVYYGLAYGTATAMVADPVPDTERGMTYGTYNGVLGLLAFPASLIVGILGQGVGAWPGLGPSAPFIFGGELARIAAGLLAAWKPPAMTQ